jgi:HAD superfamily hydrolase (TIGR01484 family)
VRLRFAPVALRCAYTDLDGTLLGNQGSLFRDSEGEFSMLQARAIEACHRAGAELVIKSGRREASVLEDAKLIGSTSYIYEVGCAVVIDGEKTVLVGDAESDPGKTLAETMVDRGIPDELFEHFAGRLEWHSPWHKQRELSLLFRGKIDTEEANRLLADRGRKGLRVIDNGAIFSPMEGIEGPAHAYHLLPEAASKANAVAFHMRTRGYPPEQCIAIGDSVEDLDVADVVGRFFVPANGPERDPALREAIAGRPNVTVTEGRMGEGVYEAVISTLAGAGAE